MVLAFGRYAVDQISETRATFDGWIEAEGEVRDGAHVEPVDEFAVEEWGGVLQALEGVIPFPRRAEVADEDDGPAKVGRW
jgi:hypothetical protein